MRVPSTSTPKLHLSTPTIEMPMLLEDSTVTLCPYFKVKDLAKFKEIWKAAYDPFAHKEDCVHYSFGFT